MKQIFALIFLFVLLLVSIGHTSLYDLWQYQSGGSYRPAADTVTPDGDVDTLAKGYRGSGQYGTALKAYIEGKTGLSYTGSYYTPMFWKAYDIGATIQYYDTCMNHNVRWWEGYYYLTAIDTQTFSYVSSSELRSDEFGIDGSRVGAVDMPGVIVQNDVSTEYAGFQYGGTNANLQIVVDDSLMIYSPYPIDSIRTQCEIAGSSDLVCSLYYYGASGWTVFDDTVNARIISALKTTSDTVISLVGLYDLYDAKFIAPATGTGNTHKQMAMMIRFTSATTYPKIDKLRKGYFWNQYTPGKVVIQPWNPSDDTDGDGWRNTGSGAMCMAHAKTLSSVSNRRILGGYVNFSCPDTNLAMWALSEYGQAALAGAINYDQSAFVSDVALAESQISTIDGKNVNDLDTFYTKGADYYAKMDSANFRWKRTMFRWTDAVKDTSLNHNSNFFIWTTVSGSFSDTLLGLYPKITGPYGTYSRGQLAAADSSNPLLAITDSISNKRFKSIDGWLLEHTMHNNPNNEIGWTTSYLGRLAGLSFIWRAMMGGMHIIGMWVVGDASASGVNDVYDIGFTDFDASGVSTIDSVKYLVRVYSQTDSQRVMVSFDTTIGSLTRELIDTFYVYPSDTWITFSTSFGGSWTDEKLDTLDLSIETYCGALTFATRDSIRVSWVGIEIYSDGVNIDTLIPNKDAYNYSWDYSTEKANGRYDLIDGTIPDDNEFVLTWRGAYDNSSTWHGEQVLNYFWAASMLVHDPYENQNDSVMWITKGRYPGVSGSSPAHSDCACGDSRDMLYGPDLEVDLGIPLWQASLDSSYAYRHNGLSDSNGYLLNPAWKNCYPSESDWPGDSIYRGVFRAFLDTITNDTNYVILIQSDNSSTLWSIDSLTLSTINIGKTGRRILISVDHGGPLRGITIDTLPASDSAQALIVDGIIWLGGTGGNSQNIENTPISNAPIQFSLLENPKNRLSYDIIGK